MTFISEMPLLAISTTARRRPNLSHLSEAEKQPRPEAAANSMEQMTGMSVRDPTSVVGNRQEACSAAQIDDRGPDIGDFLPSCQIKHEIPKGVG